MGYSEILKLLWTKIQVVLMQQNCAMRQAKTFITGLVLKNQKTDGVL